MKEIDFRKAQLFDLDGLVLLENTCFTLDKMSRDSYRRFLTKNTAEIFIAELNKKIIGSATVCFRKNSDKARLYSIAIDPSYRKLGIASTLFQCMYKSISARNCKTVILEVRMDNTGAIHFYEKHGYEHFGTYSQFYEDGTGALRMKKCL